MLVTFAETGLAAGLELDFERVPDSRAFDVSFAATGIKPNEVRVRVSHGKVGEVTAYTGRLGARIEPGRTGRIDVEIEVPSQRLAATRTALVLGYIHEDWNQPEPVPGLVNTPAWEDGAAVSSDGLWLAVQYFPVAFNCSISRQPDSKYCRTAVGPITGPMRPDMPGTSRIDQQGRIKNGCPTVGIESLAFPVPPTSLYLFARRSDGSFGSPSPIYWDGVDGCVSPYGPALLTRGTNDLMLLFAFDSPSDSGADDSHGDLFAIRLDPRKARAVGRTVSKGGKLVDVDVRGTRIGRPSKQHEANPEGWTRPDGGLVVFYDDENIRGDLFYIESDKGWLDGQWSEARRIPAPISTPGVVESQPFFDGKELYFRRETTVYRSRYKGGEMSASSAWAEPEEVLSGDLSARADGEILGAGEPTIATFNGRRELYFVFAERASDGSLNFDVGRVPERAGNQVVGVPGIAPRMRAELPLASMQAIEGGIATRMGTGVEGAAGGQALVWDYVVKPNANALLLLSRPNISRSSDEITLSAYASEETTLGLMVSEKGGVRYAVQFSWPSRKWQVKTFKWADFEFQAHGNEDSRGRLEPGAVEALLLIDASGAQGKSGNRTLQIDGLAIGGPR
ncbi:MAG: hypothetical protein HYX63_09535 [Gammaproteobacteria bacterium]|nr:hypothetical protein [Gammaproteobacteria bacterium]